MRYSLSQLYILSQETFILGIVRHLLRSTLYLIIIDKTAYFFQTRESTEKYIVLTDNYLGCYFMIT